jgi:hypothetical protein
LRRCDATSNAKGFSLKPPDRKLALDREVVELLRDDAQLLAIADAVAASQGGDLSHARAAPASWWRRLIWPRLRISPLKSD